MGDRGMAGMIVGMGMGMVGKGMPMGRDGVRVLGRRCREKGGRMEREGEGMMMILMNLDGWFYTLCY